jgi:hypothetical protein
MPTLAERCEPTSPKSFPAKGPVDVPSHVAALSLDIDARLLEPGNAVQPGARTIVSGKIVDR